MKTPPEETVAADIVSVDGSPIKSSDETAVAHRRPIDIQAGSLSDAAQKSPFDLIETTLRLGASLEQTREVIALARDMEQYDARKQFFAALARFRKNCPPIRKTKTANITSERAGSSYGYTWAPLDEINQTVTPYLAPEGLSFTFEHEQDGDKMTTICVVRHEAGHEQRTPVTLKVGGSPGMSEQQKVASTMENGRRFSLTSALGLSTSDALPDETGGGEKINDDQATVIADLIRESRTPASRFLKYFKVDAIADLLAIDYEGAVALLEENKKKATGAK